MAYKVPPDIYYGVLRAALAVGVDFYLLLAIGWKESADSAHPYGNPEAEGDRDAAGAAHSFGMFQQYDQGQGSGYSPEELKDVRFSALLAAKGLRANLDYFQAMVNKHPEIPTADAALNAAIAAHNQGRAGVSKDGWGWNAERYVYPIRERWFDYQLAGVQSETVYQISGYTTGEREAVLRQFDAIYGWANQVKGGAEWVQRHLVESKVLLGLNGEPT